MIEYMPITDAGIAHLPTLDRLNWLSVIGTKVTASGVAKLKRAVPKALIDHQ